MEFVHQIMYYFSADGIKEIIAWGGLIILFAIIFSETGLLIGFFLPGDSLLVISGFVASASDGTLHIGSLLIWLCIAAVLGDTAGYFIGLKAGDALYHREQSRWFRRDYLLKAKDFYEKYGGITIVLARFMPFIRTFAPTVAGIAKMHYPRFLSFNIFGGIGWVCSMVLIGYYFGQIPFVQKHIEKMLLLIIFLSLLPIIIQAIKAKRNKGAEPVQTVAATPEGEGK